MLFLFCIPQAVYTFIAIKVHSDFNLAIGHACEQPFVHPRRPRGSQLGQEKRRRKFLRTGRRASGVLLLKEQFLKEQLRGLCECLSVTGHKKIIMCPVRGQHLSRCFRDLLIRRGSPANSTVRRTCLALTGQLSSRRVFSENAPPPPPPPPPKKKGAAIYYLTKIVDRNRADACIINV